MNEWMNEQFFLQELRVYTNITSTSYFSLQNIDLLWMLLARWFVITLGDSVDSQNFPHVPPQTQESGAITSEVLQYQVSWYVPPPHGSPRSLILSQGCCGAAYYSGAQQRNELGSSFPLHKALIWRIEKKIR